MRLESFRGVFYLVIFLTLAGLACAIGDDEGPPNNAEVIEVSANTSLGNWLKPAVENYNDAQVEVADGTPVYVELILSDAGQAVTDIARGDSTPAIWIPDQEVWTDVLADQGSDNYVGECQSVASSPLVIAMWRPVAESLGWPGLPLGWLDIGSLAADPSAWSYYSGGAYGDSLRLGHTHPGLSASGTNTLLAIVQAAQSKTEAVTEEDIQRPIVQASVSAFEAAVSTFSTDTDDLARTMAERDVQYLGAGVMYESDVVAHGKGEIVPIYPLEGTFMANHPACLNRDLEDQERDAALSFRDYLIQEETQQMALVSGLRPVNPDVELVSPLDSPHGVDLEQPAIIFDEPDVASIYAAQDLWQAARKDVNLVMLLDVSGSMDGSKIDNMRRAAVQFVEQMGDDDFLTVIAFSDELRLIADHQQVGQGRAQIISAIENLEANGDTALYDAIGYGATIISETSSPNYANALVVLTDGIDTFSYRYAFDQNLVDMAGANDTTVFTIAYGDDADQDVLSSLAFGANGSFFLGDEANIVAIYDEMSAAFGGAVGIGR